MPFCGRNGDRMRIKRVSGGTKRNVDRQILRKTDQMGDRSGGSNGIGDDRDDGD